MAPLDPPAAASVKGVFAAALTPMKGDLAPDLGRFVKHCRWLLDTGCDGLAVLGTTGEANSLSLGERVSMLEALSEAGIAGAALMPGTGCAAIPDTVELTRKAVQLGAAGVLMLPPFYYKNVSDDGLFAAYSEVIERVGDDRLRVYLYHFPQMSMVPISYDLIARLIARYPGTIAGMKDSSGDFANMAGAAERFEGFSVLSGSDEHLLDLLKRGGAGCITAVCNIAAPLAAEVVLGFRRGDLSGAAAAQERLSNVRTAVSAYPLAAALKEIMARHAGAPGWRAIRPPLTALGAEQSADLGRRMAATGYAMVPLC